MSIPYLLSQDTVEALSARKGSLSLRQLARELRYPESYIARLSDALANRPGKFTHETENELRGRLKLHKLRRHSHSGKRSGNPIYSKEQRLRKENLGLTWRTIIEYGLQAAEREIGIPAYLARTYEQTKP